jgi:50S ribosome-binding GTPase
VTILGTKHYGDTKMSRDALQVVFRREPGRKFGALASHTAAPKDGQSGPDHELTDKILQELKRARIELEAAAGTRLSCAIRALKRVELRLARPLRVAVIGEFNSGKSSLANLLVRIESLPTAIVSNTRIPTLVYQAPEPEIWAIHRNGRREWLRADRARHGESIIRLEVGLPSPRLRAMQILDLPGLADPRFGSSLENPVLQDVDAVLWCTVSTQAWKESERIVWERLPVRLRSRGLLVATYCDLLHDINDKEKLLHRLRREAASFRDIVFVSTTKALALMEGKPEDQAEAAWKASGAGSLEVALDQLLQDVRKHRSKAAVAVTNRIAYRTLSRIESQPVLGAPSAR